LPISSAIYSLVASSCAIHDVTPPHHQSHSKLPSLAPSEAL